MVMEVMIFLDCMVIQVMAFYCMVMIFLDCMVMIYLSVKMDGLRL